MKTRAMMGTRRPRQRGFSSPSGVSGLYLAFTTHSGEGGPPVTVPQDSTSVEALRIGPVKVVRVYTSPARHDQQVTDRLGYDCPPFSQIRHLCSRKPLGRHSRC